VKVSKNWETKGRVGWVLCDDSNICHIELSKKHILSSHLESETLCKRITIEEFGSIAKRYISDKGVYNGIDALLQLKAEMNRPVIKTFNPKIIRRSGNAI
jgi:hypothetical protein